MTTRVARCAAAVLALAAVAPAGRADDEKATRRLIDQLGSPRYRDREQAGRQLAALGTPALPGLREATRSPDAEVCRRAQQLVERIEEPAVRWVGLPPDRPRPAVQMYL